MGTTYYVRVRGRVSGPFSVKQLSELKSRGRLAAFHEVSLDGDEWEPAVSLEDVFESAPPNGKKDTGVAVPAQSGASRAMPIAPACPPPPMPKEAYEYDDLATRDRKAPKGRRAFGFLLMLLLVACGVGGVFVWQDVQERQRRERDWLAAQRKQDEHDREVKRKEREQHEQWEREERRRQEEAAKSAKAQAANREVEAFLAKMDARLEKEAKRVADAQHTLSTVELIKRVSYEEEEKTSTWSTGSAIYEVYMRGSLTGSNRFRVTVCIRCRISRDSEFQLEVLGRTVLSDVRLR